MAEANLFSYQQLNTANINVVSYNHQPFCKTITDREIDQLEYHASSGVDPTQPQQQRTADNRHQLFTVRWHRLEVSFWFTRSSQQKQHYNKWQAVFIATNLSCTRHNLRYEGETPSKWLSCGLFFLTSQCDGVKSDYDKLFFTINAVLMYEVIKLLRVI